MRAEGGERKPESVKPSSDVHIVFQYHSPRSIEQLPDPSLERFEATMDQL